MQVLLDLFDAQAGAVRELLSELVGDADTACEEARSVLKDIAPHSAYLDAPDSILAQALFFCTIQLAAFLAVRSRGVDAHVYGAAMLAQLSRLSLQPVSTPDDATLAANFVGPGTHPGEFRVSLADRSEGTFDYGYDIEACAICHLYGQHDAMELVPYMCASDDVMSDLRGEGLRRSGTIALGAKRCDFRFETKAEPRRVAEAFPDKIKFVHTC